MKSIIEIAVAISLMAASSSQLPEFIKQVNIAKIYLLKKSLASNGPKAQSISKKK